MAARGWTCALRIGRSRRGPMVQIGHPAALPQCRCENGSLFRSHAGRSSIRRGPVRLISRMPWGCTRKAAGARGPEKLPVLHGASGVQSQVARAAAASRACLIDGCSISVAHREVTGLLRVRTVVSRPGGNRRSRLVADFPIDQRSSVGEAVRVSTAGTMQRYRAGEAGASSFGWNRGGGMSGRWVEPGGRCWPGTSKV